MAISPYSTPLQYEYKPLNLSGFITPLSNMQEKFDTTTAQVEEAKDLFNVAHLPFGTDSEKAKELIAIAQGKVDELAQNLATTKNYKQATSKLKELNNLWNKDPHRQGLESNAKQFEEAKKRELARVKEGKISKEKYQEWLDREVRTYNDKGGASFKADYSNEDGTYNRFTGDTGRYDDISKEYEDLQLKLAGAMKARKDEGWYKSAGIDMDTFNKHFKKSSVSQLTDDEIARDVENYLRQQPRFKKVFEEDADYGFDKIQYSKNFNDYASQIATERLATIDKYLPTLEEQLKKEKKPKEEDATYQRLMQEKQELTNSATTGEYDPNKIKNIYMNQQINKTYDMSALGDLYEQYERTTSERNEKIDKDSDEGRRLGMYSEKDAKLPIADAIERMEYDASSDKKIVANNAKSLYNILGGDKGILNLSNGNMRTLIVGKTVEPGIGGMFYNDAKKAAGAKYIKKNNIEKNAGAQYERAEAILNASVTSNGDFKAFKQKLVNAGIRDIDNDAAWKVYQDLTKKDGSPALTELRQAVDNGREAYANYTTAKNNVALVEEATFKDKDYLTASSTIENRVAMIPNTQTVIGSGSAGFGAGSFASNPKDIPHPMFVASKYSKEQLKAKGISSSKERLTFNDVAKLNGYKDYNDAVKKGYNFDGVKTSVVVNGKTYIGTAQDIKNKFVQEVGQKGLSTQKMAYELINTPKTSGELAQMFSTTEGLAQRINAKTELANKPGFDEKGNPLGGTRVVTEKGRAPRIVIHGEDTYYSISYNYIGENGKTQSKQVLAKAKPDDKAYLTSTYTNMINDLEKKSDDPLARQTLSTVKTALYNVRFGSDINNVKANNIVVGNVDGHREGNIGSIVLANSNGRPMEVKVVKVYKENGSNDFHYSLKYPDGTYRGQWDSIEQYKVAMADY